MNRPAVKAAFAFVDKNRAATLKEWSAITEINAPSGKERPRAEYIEKLLRGYKLTSVRYDATGNLIAERRGTGGGPRVVFDAHLDTVFQEGLKIKTVIRDGKIYAPGVGDDTRNIEALLAMIRALNAARIKTRGDLGFASPGEDGFARRGKYVKEKEAASSLLALAGGYEGFTTRHRHQLVQAPLHRPRRPHALAHAALLRRAPARTRHRAHLRTRSAAQSFFESERRDARRLGGRQRESC